MHDASTTGVSSGTDVLGRYHLVCPLAKGGMATVWLAIDPDTGRKVAVKRMLPRVLYDHDLRRCFLDEAHLGLRLAHPNLVQTIEIGEVPGGEDTEPYLVLELLRGRTLAELARAARSRGEQLPVGFVLRVIAEAARGLHHAHTLADDGIAMGVVHRDVSPQNVFICADGRIKVVDFGIAKNKRQEHSSDAGVIKGKVAYVAPDQLRGQAPDARIDVFALGILLHEMLTGQSLFAGADDAETLFRILRHAVPPPELMRPEISPAVGAIVLRALQRDRDRRLPSAEALADLIDVVAEVEAIPLGDEEIRTTLARLFPTDEALHYERDAQADRLIDHLTTPTALRPRPRAQRWRVAMAAGALCLGAIAAAATSHYVRGRVNTARAAEISTSSPRRVSLPPTVLVPPSLSTPTPSSPPRTKKHKSASDCAVYYSLTKGQTVRCR